MSATLEPGWLDTVDFRGMFLANPLELDEKDYDSERPLHKRMTAEKTLGKLDAEVSKDGKAVAKAVWEKHERGTQTLVVLNTVDRAKAVYVELEKLRKKADSPKLLLVHSRFRPAERQHLNAALTDKAAADRIVVATQVVEAGVDISSRTLVTELAPWASVVQRIGRCNRTGDDGPGHVFWIDLDAKLAPPYSEEDIDFARQHLERLDGRCVSPKALDDYKREAAITLPFEHTHVIRRRDVLDLFDTAPDLSGNDIDVSRFVRSDDADTDVQVFWRDTGINGPDRDQPQPVRRELCNVPVGQARDFLKMLAEKKRGAGYVWDHLSDGWVKLDPARVRPGLQILLPASLGGYSALGWDLQSTAAVPALPPESENATPGEAAGADLNSETSAELTITQHTENVCTELEALLTSLGSLLDAWADDLRPAARWHDAGKAHGAFQHGVRAVNDRLDPAQLWAKSGKKGRLRYSRPHFRHELASALAALQNAVSFRTAYLIGSHHGRVRLGIRTLPNEEPPDDPEVPFALGLWEGDKLPPVDLGNGSRCPETVLSLAPMRLGGDESWTARALALLTELGPFKLAYLEAVLRAADVRASQKEAGHA
jgi:CRISPR-associated endonuclease/helicase Cas3